MPDLDRDRVMQLPLPKAPPAYWLPRAPEPQHSACQHPNELVVTIAREGNIKRRRCSMCAHTWLEVRT